MYVVEDDFQLETFAFHHNLCIAETSDFDIVDSTKKYMKKLSAVDFLFSSSNQDSKDTNYFVELGVIRGISRICSYHKEAGFKD